MAGPALHERAHCPGCLAPDDWAVLYPPPGASTFRYDDRRMVAYLDAFYGGRVDHALLAGYRYELRRCDRCGLRYQAFAPGEQVLDALYGTWIEPTASRERKLEREPLLAAEYRTLLERLAAAVDGGREGHGLVLLDLGMGWGAFARAAVAMGFRVVGIEVSEEQRRAAQHDGIEVRTPHDLASGALDGTVDVAVAIQVFEHLVDPAGVARDLGRALRPGGLLHVEVPDGSDRRLKPLVERADWEAPKNTRWSLNPVAPLEHLNCWTPGALRTVLEHAGLVPLKGRAQARLQPPSSVRTRLRATGAIAATGRRPGPQAGRRRSQ